MAETNNALVKVEKLKNLLKVGSVEEQFRNSLKKNSGAFVASLIELYSSNTDLQSCEPKDLVMEALKAASLNLPINKNLGFAWIIPRREKGVMKPNFQIGYKGYIQLAMRTGQYRFINCNVVPGTMDVIENLLSGEIVLKRNENKEEDWVNQKPIGYFAHFQLLNGFSKTLYSTREESIKHMKDYVKGYESKWSPWHTEFDKMALKTVLSHLLSTYGVLSTEMLNVFSQSKETISAEENSDLNANKLDISMDDAEEAKIVPEEKEEETKETKVPKEFE